MNLTITENTAVSDIPDILRHLLINKLAHFIFSAAIANAIVNNVGQDRDHVLEELLTTFFEKHPNASLVLSVDVHAEVGNLRQHVTTADQVIEIPSDTTPNVTYKVYVRDGHAYSCECKGFEHRGMCKHLHRAERIAR